MFLSEILIKEGLAAYKTQFEIRQEATLTTKISEILPLHSVITVVLSNK